MEKSWGLLFYLKKPGYYVSGPVPIYMRITVDGIEREMSTKLQADPEKWSSEANRLTGKSDLTKAINDALDTLEAKAIQARTQLIAMNKPVTADYVKAIIQNKPLEPVRTIKSVFKDHNDKMRALV